MKKKYVKIIEGILRYFNKLISQTLEGLLKQKLTEEERMVNDVLQRIEQLKKIVKEKNLGMEIEKIVSKLDELYKNLPDNKELLREIVDYEAKLVDALKALDKPIPQPDILTPLEEWLAKFKGKPERYINVRLTNAKDFYTAISGSLSVIGLRDSEGQTINPATKELQQLILDKIGNLSSSLTRVPEGKVVTKVGFWEDDSGNIRYIKFYDETELLFTLEFSNAGEANSETWSITRI